MTEFHDHPVEPEPGSEPELFIDFANTLVLNDGRPTDRVGGADAMRRWLVERSLAASNRTTGAQMERELPAFRELRDLVRDLVARQAAGRPPTTRQLRSLNGVLRAGTHYHQLKVDRSGERFCIGQVGDDMAQARAAIAGSLAHYLADHDRNRLRVCADHGCRWLFVDRSPAGRRRWCDMRTCGNRAKVARHRARARGAVTAASSA
jgi:predicted RNA-binding Zn ribbon-like protein